MRRQIVLGIGLIIGATGLASAQRPVESRDLLRLREVSDPQLSPDGGWVAYTVSTADTTRDRVDKDIWMTSWDGARSVRVTSSPDQEHAPRWSPDGRYLAFGRQTIKGFYGDRVRLAFLSARQDPHEADQLWLLDRAGGEAERVTSLPGGISEYAWAPDGHRLALIASLMWPWYTQYLGPRSRGSAGRLAADRRRFDPAPAETDRGGPLRLQVRRRGLSGRRAGSSVPLRPGDPARRGGDAGALRRGGAVVVPRRTPDRVREPAAARVRPHRQLGHLRRRRQGRGRAPPDHHLRRRRPGPGVGQPRPLVESRRQAARLRAGRATGADLLRCAEGGRGAGGRRARPGAHGRNGSQRPFPHVQRGREVGALPAGGRSGLPPGPGAGRRRRGRAAGERVPRGDRSDPRT